MEDNMLEEKMRQGLQKAYDVCEIETPEVYDLAVKEREHLKELKLEIDVAFDTQIFQAHALHKSAIAAKKKYMDPVEKADAVLKRGISAYEQKLRRVAEEDRQIAEELGAPGLAVMSEVSASSATTYMRKYYSAKVVNLPELLKAVLAGTQPIELVLPNQVMLNSMATSYKADLKIPGVALEIKEVPCDR